MPCWHCRPTSLRCSSTTPWPRTIWNTSVIAAGATTVSALPCSCAPCGTRGGSSLQERSSPTRYCVSSLHNSASRPMTCCHTRRARRPAMNTWRFCAPRRPGNVPHCHGPGKGLDRLLECRPDPHVLLKFRLRRLVRRVHQVHDARQLLHGGFGTFLHNPLYLVGVAKMTQPSFFFLVCCKPPSAHANVRLVRAVGCTCALVPQLASRTV